MAWAVAGMDAGSDFTAIGAERGNSYRIWQDATHVRLYEASSNVATLRASFAAANAAGQTHSYQVIYNPLTGVLQVARDGNPLGSWTDTTLLTSGGYLSLRTDGSSVQYDANGNVTRRINPAGIDISLTYDQENRLITVSGNRTASYTYDGDGVLVKAVDSSNNITTVVVGPHYEVRNTTPRKYYYAGSVRVAMRDNGTLYFLLSDHLGSTNLTLDSSGNRLDPNAELRYKPYGDTRYNGGGQKTNYRFTGQRWDQGHGLYWYNSRWFDPLVGRFMQADSIVPDPGNPQALNRYSYVRNNPLKYTDPTGHVFIEGTGGGGGYGTPWWENNRAKDRPFSIRNIGPGGQYGQGEIPLGDHMVSVYLPPTVRTYQNSEGLLPLYEPKYGLATPTSYAPEHDVEDYWWGDEVPGKNAVQPNQWKRVTTQRRVEGPNVQGLVEGLGRGLAGIPASLELSPEPTRGEVAANALIVGANVANGLAGAGWESTFVLQVNPTTGGYRVIILSRPGYAHEQFYRTFQGLYVINWGSETIGRRR